jgi:hypothetical protein
MARGVVGAAAVPVFRPLPEWRVLEWVAAVEELAEPAAL